MISLKEEDRMTTKNALNIVNGDLYQKIVELLKKNPRGMNIWEIAEKISLNRLSVSRYLEIMAERGLVEHRILGKSEIYYVSHGIPVTNHLTLSQRDLSLINTKIRDLVNYGGKCMLSFTITDDSMKEHVFCCEVSVRHRYNENVNDLAISSAGLKFMNTFSAENHENDTNCTSFQLPPSSSVGYGEILE